MPAYYNEIDPYAAQWLRNLIAAGHIAPGEVDERSILDVRPDDLRGFEQCHFFAGVGVWSHALRMAGWGDDRQVWTGSCPCQPFSQAGQGAGFDDERHLWPAFHHLICECGPRVVFGEQVASKDGLAWLDLVQADMEAEGYAFGALDMCAAGFGAPHIRQRLYWVADADKFPRGQRRPVVRRISERGDAQSRAGLGEHGRIDILGVASGGGREGIGDQPTHVELVQAGSHAGELADADGRDASAERLQRGRQHGLEPQDCRAHTLANTSDGQLQESGRRPQERDGHGPDRSNAPTGPVNGVWRDADWLLCRDGKWRPVRSGTFPLAHGAPARVGRLRAYGNAIVASQACEFITAAM